MKRDGGSVYKSCLYVLLLALSFSVGCGGGSSSGTPPITPVNIQGQYEVIASSTGNPSGVSLIETNFNQAGTSVAASNQNVVVIQGTQDSNGITLVSLGGECDNGSLGHDSIQGTFSSPTQAAISFNEAGSLGSVTAAGNVTFAPDGNTMTAGTYSIPAACGFLADNGQIVGTKISPFSGSYAGMLNGGADAIIVSVNQSGLNLTVAGTDNGTATRSVRMRFMKIPS